MDGYRYVYTQEVAFRDLDVFGHVNNGVYLTYIENARIGYMREVLGIESLEGLLVIVASVKIDFRSRANLGDTLEIGARTTRVGTKSFDLEHEIRAQDGRLVAEAQIDPRRLRLRRGRDDAHPARVARTDRKLRSKERCGHVNAFEKTVLPNGLRVVTAPMPQAKSVACFVMLAAGSRYETKDTNGIAHFAEHMFFKGTERRPTAREIAGEIDSIGGEFNAFTGKEYTGYYVKCAAEHRDMALDVLVDMLRHSKFDPEEIEREKGVIVEEMNMYYDTPARLRRRRLRRAPLQATRRWAGTSSAARRPCALPSARPSSTTSTAGTARRAWSRASPATSATT